MIKGVEGENHDSCRGLLVQIVKLYVLDKIYQPCTLCLKFGLLIRVCRPPVT